MPDVSTCMLVVWHVPDAQYWHVHTNSGGIISATGINTSHHDTPHASNTSDARIAITQRMIVSRGSFIRFGMERR